MFKKLNKKKFSLEILFKLFFQMFLAPLFLIAIFLIAGAFGLLISSKPLDGMMKAIYIILIGSYALNIFNIILCFVPFVNLIRDIISKNKTEVKELKLINVLPEYELVEASIAKKRFYIDSFSKNLNEESMLILEDKDCKRIRLRLFWNQKYSEGNYYPNDLTSNKIIKVEYLKHSHIIVDLKVIDEMKGENDTDYVRLHQWNNHTNKKDLYLYNISLAEKEFNKEHVEFKIEDQENIINKLYNEYPTLNTSFFLEGYTNDLLNLKDKLKEMDYPFYFYSLGDTHEFSIIEFNIINKDILNELYPYFKIDKDYAFIYFKKEDEILFSVGNGKTKKEMFGHMDKLTKTINKGKNKKTLAKIEEECNKEKLQKTFTNINLYCEDNERMEKLKSILK